MLNTFRRKVAAAIAAIASYPPIRYGFLLPLGRILTADSDEQILLRSFRFAQHTLAGDYLEFGVWKGRSFVKAFHIWDRLMRRSGKLVGMRFFAFDSFQGLPEIRTEEDKSTGEFKRGDYTFGRHSFERVLTAKKVPHDRVHIVPGWFSESLTEAVKDKHDLRQAAVVWIDCDLYESTVPVLDFLTNLIGPGTIIIFDDWFCFGGRPDRGEQKAFSEWLARNPDIKAVPWHSPSWKSQSFILYRTS